jgi:hypothetical protein
MAILVEDVLDAIAEKLITNNPPVINQQIVLENQKTIRDGILTLGRTNADRLILYEKDVKANKEDLELQGASGNSEGKSLENIVDLLSDQWSINIEGDENSITLIQILDASPGEFGYSDYDITPILSVFNEDDPTRSNPINVSQFVNILQTSTTIYPDQANEFLDTTIFELLPGSQTRQERIIAFFDEYNALRGDLPEFNLEEGLVSDDFSSQEYHFEHDISAAQDDDEATIAESESFITRLDSDANSENTSYTLQSLRDNLNEYLKDIDEQPLLPQDQRPTYTNESDGYLKFRNLNQGIIIRNTESQYIEGLNPQTQDYLDTGFTITMWVRFLDKVSQGTLFNFGNPTRDTNPLGFKLETLVSVDGNRYVRLLVWDGTRYYDSHTGTPSYDKINTTDLSSLNDIDISQYTQIPTDFSDWYFICANYDPIDVDEAGSDLTNSDINYWLNHVDADGEYVTHSGLGNRAKVEFISRSDLLRARGYKV